MVAAVLCAWNRFNGFCFIAWGLSREHCTAMGGLWRYGAVRV